MSNIPFVAIGVGEKPPWGNDRTCPDCGEEDLPLLSSTSDTGRITLHYIKHCGSTWLRGPLDVST